MRASDILQGAALIVAIVAGLAQTSPRHGSVILYAGYGIALFLFVVALVLSNRELARPRIVPVRYGRDNAEGRYGLIIENEAESSAFDISIADSEIPIGPAWLTFSGGISRLTKGSGQAFIEAGIRLPSRTSLFGNALFEEMRKHQVVLVAVNITYKDGDNRWYKSVCQIERDVLAKNGLTTRFVRRQRIWRPTHKSS